MTPLRLLVVDDEPLARKRVRSLLAEHDDVDVIGECSDGREAIAAVREHDPDVLLLDIQMPELDGFGVIEAIGPGRRPAVVFVTAFNQYAVKAFEVNALDYLLKPFDAERLNSAIRKARERLSRDPAGAGDFEGRVLAAIELIRGREQHADRIAVRVDERVILLAVSSIDWIEATGKHCRLHVGDREYLHREALKELEAKLDPCRFARIHRSTIVNLDSVELLEPMFHGEYSVLMKNGTRLTLSRGYRTKMRERFGKML